MTMALQAAGQMPRTWMDRRKATGSRLNKNSVIDTKRGLAHMRKRICLTVRGNRLKNG